MARDSLPIIDIGPLMDSSGHDEAGARTAAEIGLACERWGFFVVVGHGIDTRSRARLTSCARAFFALSDSEKAEISMVRGGAAWRGWFPVGDELTSGLPDGKEGVYFGTDLAPDDPRARAGVPLQGPNLYPRRPVQMREVVDTWMRDVVEVARVVLSGIARHLGLEPDWFDRWCGDPTVLFRMFHYPGTSGDGGAATTGPAAGNRWGVAEHTDYGLLTLLAIAGDDDPTGLQVLVDDEWFDVPSVADSFVCNLGDMLELATAGRFVSTAHRVQTPTTSRYSFPLFLDPGWDAEIHAIPGAASGVRPRRDRWDHAELTEVSGTYGEYLSAKVGKVFPELFDATIRPGPGMVDDHG